MVFRQIGIWSDGTPVNLQDWVTFGREGWETGGFALRLDVSLRFLSPDGEARILSSADPYLWQSEQEAEAWFFINQPRKKSILEQALEVAEGW